MSERPPPGCDLCGRTRAVATATYRAASLDPIRVAICERCIDRCERAGVLSEVEHDTSTQRIRMQMVTPRPSESGKGRG